MHNEILTIGPITIYGYGLMIAIGVIAALLTADYRAKKRNLSGDEVYIIVIMAVILGFLSAKILFIITNLRAFLLDPISFISSSGFVVYGGIIGAIIAILIYCRIKKLQGVAYLDLLAPSVALAQGFGRIGCLLAGCCYGRETDSIIGIVFSHSDFAPNGVKLIPTQIIMSIGDFAIAGILFAYGMKESSKGKMIFLYLTLYSIGRFLVEFLRGDARGNVGILSTSQFIGIFIIIVGLAGFFYLVPRLNRTNEES